jgi:hypothetical protein
MLLFFSLPMITPLLTLGAIPWVLWKFPECRQPYSDLLQTQSWPDSARGELMGSEHCRPVSPMLDTLQRSWWQRKASWTQARRVTAVMVRARGMFISPNSLKTNWDLPAPWAIFKGTPGGQYYPQVDSWITHLLTVSTIRTTNCTVRDLSLWQV